MQKPQDEKSLSSSSAKIFKATGSRTDDFSRAATSLEICQEQLGKAPNESLASKFGTLVEKISPSINEPRIERRLKP